MSIIIGERLFGKWPGRLAIVVFVVFLLSCLVASTLGVVEIFLRYQRHKQEQIHPPQKALIPDPDLGWDSNPDMIALENNAGRKDVIYFVGDSFTHHAAWPVVTQKQLAKKGVLFNGFSLGVPGFGTVQEYLKLRRLFNRYRPTIVVLQFYAWNDLRDNFFNPPIYYNKQTRHRPYLYSSVDGVALQPPSSPSIFEKLEIYDRIFMRAEYIFAKLLVRFFDFNALTRHHIPVQLPYSFLSSWTCFYKAEAVASVYREQAWAATEIVLNHTKNFLDENHCRLLVLGIDNPFTVDQDVYEAHFKDERQVDIDAPLKRLGEILKRLGIPYVNCSEPFRLLRAQIQKKVYNGPPGNLSGHLEPEAEERLGMVAAEEIQAILKRPVHQ